MTTSVYVPHPVDGKYFNGKPVTVGFFGKLYPASVFVMWGPTWAYVTIPGLGIKTWLRDETLDRWN